MKAPTFYHLLGVDAGASHEDLKRARARLARQAHPDMGGTHDAMAALNLAYETLNNPELAKLYAADIRYKMKLKDCQKCEGAGFWWQQKGFTGRVRVACPQCAGVGAAPAAGWAAYKEPKR